MRETAIETRNLKPTSLQKAAAKECGGEKRAAAMRLDQECVMRYHEVRNRKFPL